MLWTSYGQRKIYIVRYFKNMIVNKFSKYIYSYIFEARDRAILQRLLFLKILSIYFKELFYINFRKKCVSA